MTTRTVADDWLLRELEYYPPVLERVSDDVTVEFSKDDLELEIDGIDDRCVLYIPMAAFNALVAANDEYHRRQDQS